MQFVERAERKRSRVADGEAGSTIGGALDLVEHRHGHCPGSGVGLAVGCHQQFIATQHRGGGLARGEQRRGGDADPVDVGDGAQVFEFLELALGDGDPGRRVRRGAEVLDVKVVVRSGGQAAGTEDVDKPQGVGRLGDLGQVLGQFDMLMRGAGPVPNALTTTSKAARSWLVSAKASRFRVGTSSRGSQRLCRCRARSRWSRDHAR